MCHCHRPTLHYKNPRTLPWLYGCTIIFITFTSTSFLLKCVLEHFSTAKGFLASRITSTCQPSSLFVLICHHSAPVSLTVIHWDCFRSANMSGQPFMCVCFADFTTQDGRANVVKKGGRGRFRRRTWHVWAQRRVGTLCWHPAISLKICSLVSHVNLWKRCCN